MSKLSRFLSLPSEDRQLVFRAWWVMLGFWTAIRTMPFRKVVEMAKVQLAQIDLAEVGPQVDTDRVSHSPSHK